MRVTAPSLLCLLLAITFSGSSLAVGLSARKSSDNSHVPEDSAQIAEMAQSSENLAPEEVEGFVAPLSDRSARALLIEQLTSDAEARSAAQADSMKDNRTAGLIQIVQQRTLEFSERFDASTEALQRLPATWRLIFNNLTDLQGWPAMRHGMLALAIMLAGGYLAQWLIGRLGGERLGHLTPQAGQGWLPRLGFLALRLLSDLLRVAAFTLVAWGVSFVFFERFDPMRLFATAYLSVVVILWLSWMAARFVLAPQASGARLLRLDDAEARSLNRWLLLLVGVAAMGFFSHGLLALLGLPVELQRLFQIALGGVLAAMLVALIWRKRQRVATAIGGGADSARLRQNLAQLWHLLATGYLVGLWGLWSIDVLLAWEAQAKAAVYSLLVLLALPLIDRLLLVGLKPLFRADAQADEEGRQRVFRLCDVVHNALRCVLLTVAVVVLTGAWWPGFYSLLQSESGTLIAHSAVNIAVTVLIAYIAWQAIRTYIDPQLQQEEEGALLEIEGEGGGTPASRAQTLLPLFRSFAVIVLSTMLIMVVLSSLGVNIGPLLAGAGVIGLAIGFGAQKLVQDIISGIFFLVDDAFRVGEYVEAGEMRGTVESISLRSMKLRHHLGMVQTIPYGEIAAINNHSRDWIMMKLEFRMPYDTDIEKVRKIIKKVGLKMKEDPELGQHLLQPLKSQGVLRIEESALILRMKFMAVPGQQWIIRREAYRRVKEAFDEQGLAFAHRKVFVEGPAQLTDAAAAALQTEPAGPPKPTQSPQ